MEGGIKFNKPPKMEKNDKTFCPELWVWFVAAFVRVSVIHFKKKILPDPVPHCKLTTKADAA